MYRLIIISLCLFIVACSNSPVDTTQTAKSNSGTSIDTLEKMASINQFILKSWQPLDRRHLLVRTESQSYVFVLAVPDIDILHSKNITISSSAGRVQAGFDTVYIPLGFERRTTINRIYLIKDELQEQAIIAEFIQRNPHK